MRFAAAALLALTLAGCGQTPGQRAVSGGLIGAGTGAGVGALTGGGVGTGALIGGGVGAAGGALTAPSSRSYDRGTYSGGGSGGYDRGGRYESGGGYDRGYGRSYEGRSGYYR